MNDRLRVLYRFSALRYFSNPEQTHGRSEGGKNEADFDLRRRRRARHRADLDVGHDGVQKACGLRRDPGEHGDATHPGYASGSRLSDPDRQLLRSRVQSHRILHDVRPGIEQVQAARRGILPLFPGSDGPLHAMSMHEPLWCQHQSAFLRVTTREGSRSRSGPLPGPRKKRRERVAPASQFDTYPRTGATGRSCRPPGPCTCWSSNRS